MQTLFPMYTRALHVNIYTIKQHFIKQIWYFRKRKKESCFQYFLSYMLEQ